ncbi:MAG: hypothetical protein B0W54_23975 [Cellvibrio sp. 79]|nr:MAG: hypothetical protein B0W54_23975 [Cellvibrio sp. 79]
MKIEFIQKKMQYILVTFTGKWLIFRLSLKKAITFLGLKVLSFGVEKFPIQSVVFSIVQGSAMFGMKLLMSNNINGGSL